MLANGLTYKTDTTSIDVFQMLAKIVALIESKDRTDQRIEESGCDMSRLLTQTRKRAYAYQKKQKVMIVHRNVHWTPTIEWRNVHYLIVSSIQNTQKSG